MLQPTSKALIKTILKIVISVGLITFFFIKFDFLDAINRVGNLPIINLLFVLLIVVLANLVSAIKWKVLMPTINFTRLLEALLASRFYSMVLPGQLFGEASKIVFLASDAKQNSKNNNGTQQLAASVIMDKLTGLIGLIAIAALGTIFNSNPIARDYFLPIALTIFLLLVSALSLFHWKRFDQLVSKALSHIKSKFTITSRTIDKLFEFINVWQVYLHSPKILLVATLLGFIFQILIMFIHATIGYFFALNISLWDWCWIAGIVSIIVFIPLSIGGIGIRESGYVGVLALLGISSDFALSVSFTIFLMQLIIAFVGGICILFRAIKGKVN